MSRFIFECASQEDGQELLDILEDSEFQGRISLLYTRRPDAYRSFKREGEQVDIVVCRDTQQGKIVGFGACTRRKLYVNGSPATVGYLFGLRLRREYRKKFPLLHQGYNFLHTLHQSQEIAFYITTIFEENRYTRKLLEKQRPYMPAYIPYGSYHVYALKPGRKTQKTTRIRQAQQGDIPTLVQFLKEHGRTGQFFPVIEEKNLREGRFTHLKVEDFYLLCDDRHTILAAGAIWDQRSYKQYIVQGYSGVLKHLYPLSRFFPVVGFPALPKPRGVLKFFTLAFLTVKENDPAIFQEFLNAISAVAPPYPFFLIGMHERHPLHEILQKRPHISHTSRLYMVAWDEEQHDNVDKLDATRYPYLECSLL